MPNLIKALSLQWDLWIGQYRAFFPINEEDRQACFRILQNKDGVKSLRMANGDTQTAMEYGTKISTQLAACLDTHKGEIIACLELADARERKSLPDKGDHYKLALFDKDRLANIAVITSLAMLPGYQKTAAVPVLLSHCFIEILKAGGQAVLTSCVSEYFSVYKRLGMRPIGSLQKTDRGEVHIPLILIPDKDYLSIIQSPALPLLRGLDFSPYESLCQWYYGLVRENSELQIGSTFYPEDDEDYEGHHAITEGLSPQGRDAFLKNALVIKCQEGEVLMQENEGGKSFGFVRKGMLKVMIGSQTVVLLSEGDVFGEIAYILHSKRSARVVATSQDTEVVLFSESAINRLEQEADRTIIWRNLARVLAQKITLTNKLLG